MKNIKKAQHKPCTIIIGTLEALQISGNKSKKDDQEQPKNRSKYTKKRDKVTEQRVSINSLF